MRTRDTPALFMDTCVICLLMPVRQSADAGGQASQPDDGPGAGRGTHFIVHPQGGCDHPTIQAASDASDQGGVVGRIDGVFTATGNQNLRVCRMAITVRARSDDPNRCMIEASGHPLSGFRIGYPRERP